jgi:hypothetical protein
MNFGHVAKLRLAIESTKARLIGLLLPAQLKELRALRPHAKGNG